MCFFQRCFPFFPKLFQAFLKFSFLSKQSMDAWEFAPNSWDPWHPNSKSTWANRHSPWRQVDSPKVKIWKYFFKVKIKINWKYKKNTLLFLSFVLSHTCAELSLSQGKFWHTSVYKARLLESIGIHHSKHQMLRVWGFPSPDPQLLRRHWRTIALLSLTSLPLIKTAVAKDAPISNVQ